MAKEKRKIQTGTLLTFAARRHRATVSAALAKHELFAGQEHVLAFLQDQGPSPMTTLADVLQIRPPTASKMIGRMEAQGLVMRGERGDDARVVIVSLTPDGEALAARLESVAKSVEKQLLKGFDDKDVRRLRRLLKKAARNLGGDDATSEEPDPDEITTE
jgi:DNA-binding MarR family transcriptional regulator